jgi:YrbI family 3-deoxy-D-manno-octulosonate 8-phosphate phosphatase
MKRFNLGWTWRISRKDIQAIVFDFDGVFTDNKVTVTEDGKESVVCNRADGLGIGMLRAENIPLLILSMETNRVVVMRARKLALNALQGIVNKKETLITYCREKGIDIRKVMYVGNDLNDYEVMKAVGYPVAPEDAHPKIRRIAKYIIHKKGGEGVIKELAEKLIFGWER